MDNLDRMMPQHLRKRIDWDQTRKNKGKKHTMFQTVTKIEVDPRQANSKLRRNAREHLNYSPSDLLSNF